MDFSYADELYANGVVVIRLDYVETHLDEIRDEFEKTMQAFPEFKKHPGFAEISKSIIEGQINRYSLGGTSFIGGTPSAFHNEFVRLMRAIIMRLVVPAFFKPYVEKYLDSDYQVEQVACRILIRPPGDTPSPESWHRDKSPGADRAKGDITFGGWCNFDKTPQVFSCILGSHLTAETDAVEDQLNKKHLGFVKETSKALLKELRKKKTRVVIPPGHLCLFIEDLLHEVASVKKDVVSIRQFFGWRLTKSTDSIIGTKKLMNFIDTQAVVTIKSGQIPPIWPRAYSCYYKPQLALFLAEMIVDPETNLMPKKSCYKSLSETGLPMYPAYLPFEKALLLPAQEFHVIDPQDKPFRELSVLTTPTVKIGLFGEGLGKRRRSDSIGY